jgi:hypothetical protein
VCRINGVTRAIAILLAAAGCVGASCAAAGASPSEAAKQPLVVVVRHGGLCVTRTECKTMFRITDTTISGDGYRPRALSSTARRSLIRAIGDVSPAYLRSHPFKGICPIAYDAPESIYRFRGFTPSIPSCKCDVRGLEAVRLTERLLAALKPIR